MSRFFLVLGAFSAALSVVLGAIGAHAFQPSDVLLQKWFEIALHYQQFHALGLLVIGLLLQRYPRQGHPCSRWFTASGLLMTLGTVVFSGNLYLRSLFDFHALHAMTPVGGAALIVAWLCLTVGVWRSAGET